MFEIKANPLRVSATVFTAIIVLLMVVQKSAPGRYTIPPEKSLTTEIAGIPVTFKELHELLSQTEQDFLLVDIRTESQYNAGHLKDAVNIPTAKILDRKSRRKLAKQQNIIYCSTEAMAHSVAFLLNQCNYDCRPVNGNYSLIKTNVVDKFIPSMGFYSEEKQQYNYPVFIKQQDAPHEFKVDKQNEIKTQSGC